jgi:hypothetical protein
MRTQEFQMAEVAMSGQMFRLGSPPAQRETGHFRMDLNREKT